jgi:riboflavin-specific deaminase-like protein
LLELRATVDAVMCGTTTAGAEGISLGPGPRRFRALRQRRGLAEYNLRVIVSGSGRINPEASVFRHRFSPIIVLTTRRAPTARLKPLRAAAKEVAVFGKREVDLPSALRWLRKQWNVRRLLCEGGGQLNDAMFRAGLVDEVHVTVCPKIFGGRNAPTLADGLGFARLADATPLRLKTAKRVGDEMFLVYSVIRETPAAPRASTQRAISHSKSARRLK